MQCRDKFFFGDSTDIGKLWSHGDIHQIVDGGEDAKLGEFSDACDEAEFYLWLLLLQALVKFLHHFPHFLQL